MQAVSITYDGSVQEFTSKSITASDQEALALESAPTSIVVAVDKLREQGFHVTGFQAGASKRMAIFLRADAVNAIRAELTWIVA